jgi:hypothetical protein
VIVVAAHHRAARLGAVVVVGPRRVGDEITRCQNGVVTLDQLALATENPFQHRVRADKGVPEDDAKAFYWYRKAAVQGNVRAWLSLGLNYALGEGVPEDEVKAYAWISVAAAQGDDLAQKFKGMVEEEMTREEIAKGQGLAAEYWKMYVVPFQKN